MLPASECLAPGNESPLRLRLLLLQQTQQADVTPHPVAGKTALPFRVDKATVCWRPPR